MRIFSVVGSLLSFGPRLFYTADTETAAKLVHCPPIALSSIVWIYHPLVTVSFDRSCIDKCKTILDANAKASILFLMVSSGKRPVLGLIVSVNSLESPIISCTLALYLSNISIKSKHSAILCIDLSL